MHIGLLIKKHRLERNMTQHELADKLGVDRQYIWKIEKGRINLTLDYLDKIITNLKCDLKHFFKTEI